MPLKKGTSKEVLAHNYDELTKSGYKHDQAVAIMLHQADKSKTKTSTKSKNSK